MAETTDKTSQAPTEAEGGQAEGGDGGETTRRARKIRVGVVTSDRSEKTVTVTVERRFAHPLYGKQVARTKKYHAHDENNEYRVGDIVRITETRPLSKTKRWRVLELLERPE
jgi:small subunit ribosomal protein S17